MSHDKPASVPAWFVLIVLMLTVILYAAEMRTDQLGKQIRELDHRVLQLEMHK